MAAGVDLTANGFSQGFGYGETEAGRMAAAGYGVKTVEKMAGLNFIQSGSMVDKTKGSFSIHLNEKFAIAVLGRIADNIRQNP